jgi:2,3-bisphosphoglycerate-independent phosphoglycerate mutase
MFFFGTKKRKKESPITMLKVNRPKPVVLAVLDGWGVIQDYSGNAITQANTENYHNLIARYPAATLQASGESVGLPWGQEGNSEVGHLNLGLGRVVYQDLPRINRSITDNSFFTNAAFYKAVKHLVVSGGDLHLMGLVSAAGIHATIEHLQALLRFAKMHAVKAVYIHAFLDGRDTPYNSGLSYIRDLEASMKEEGVGKLATLSGRFYAMDRDNHWDRIGKAYIAMTQGKGNTTEDPEQAISQSYEKKIYDEEFVPTVVQKNGQPVALIKDGDAIIFTNFRPDRARQLSKAFILPGFNKFERTYLNNLLFVSMTEYENDLPVEVAYPPEIPKNSVGEMIASQRLTQLRIAETEKYAHVTYFFNGGRETKSEGETHELVPSPAVESYAQKPEMSAFEITDRIIEAINAEKYDFILVNFANADMVGHTGNLEATIKAVETVDRCLGKISQTILAKNGVLMITADHGNAEIKVNIQTGEMSKEHTINPVPFILVGNEYEGKNIGWPEVLGGDLSLVSPIGVLSDVAPTVLKILNITKPIEMMGRSLL